MTSKKFFSLIHNKSINIAPNTKIVPANSIAQLIDADDALKQVHIDVEDYKKEVAAECEVLKEQAQREGFEAGFQKWAKHLAELETEIERAHKEVERFVVPVALKAAKKIVGREVELSEDIIVDIVSNNLKAVSQHKKITIYVNKKDLAVLEANRPRLKQLFESLESLSIRERSDVAPGGCVIETEAGIINAQLENQWRVLESAFEKLTQSKG